MDNSKISKCSSFLVGIFLLMVSVTGLKAQLHTNNDYPTQHLIQTIGSVRLDFDKKFPFAAGSSRYKAEGVYQFSINSHIYLGGFGFFDIYNKTNYYSFGPLVRFYINKPTEHKISFYFESRYYVIYEKITFQSRYSLWSDRFSLSTGITWKLSKNFGLDVGIRANSTGRTLSLAFDPINQTQYYFPVSSPAGVNATGSFNIWLTSKQ